MVRVKICGITRGADVDAAVAAGADAVGFISGFRASPRDIPLERVADLVSKVPPFVTTVLVTTFSQIAVHRREVDLISPDALQLYQEAGSSPVVIDPGELGRSLHTRVIRPYSPSPGDDFRGIDARGYDAVLSDTYRKGFQGGTGMVSDWTECALLRKKIAPIPLILSGGLNPENVSRAVRVVHPYAVDVSSGVEASPGVKDHARIREFIKNARDAGVS